MDERKSDTATSSKPIITLFAKDGCPYCRKAKTLLSEHGLSYEEITIDGMVTVMSLKNITGQITVPQIFINGQLISGSDKLSEYFAQTSDVDREEHYDSKAEEVESFTPAY